MKLFTRLGFLVFTLLTALYGNSQTPDIVPDTSFGINGVVYNAYNASFSRNAPAAIAVQSDGRIVEIIAGNAYAAVRRYLANGLPDTTFGNAGYVVLDTFGNYHNGQLDLKVLANDNILVSAAGGAVTFLTRLTPNGATDYTFGTSGYTTFGLLANMDIKVLSDGTIRVVNTYLNQNTNLDTAVIYKTNADGLIDSTFGTNGAYLVPQTFLRNCNFALDHNDRLIVTGRSPQGVTVLRILPGGGLDNTFGTGAYAILNDSTVSNTLILNSTIAAVLPDNGIIVIIGYVAQVINTYNYVAHLSATGVQDMSYGQAGFSQVLSGQAAVMYAPVFDNGDLLLVGQAKPGSYYGQLALLNTAGKEAPAFSGDSVYTFQYDTGSTGNHYTNVGGTIITGGNKILQAGNYQNLYSYISQFNYSGLVNGIKDMTNGPVFRIYPNPSSASCTIQVADNVGQTYTAQLVDLTSKAIGPTLTFNGQFTFNVSHYGKGLYLLKVTDNMGNQSVKKLVIE